MIERVTHPGVKVVIDKVPTHHRVGGSTLRRLYPWRLRTATTDEFDERVVYTTYHRTWFAAFSAAHARLAVDADFTPEGWMRSHTAEVTVRYRHDFGWACSACHQVTHSPPTHHQPRHIAPTVECDDAPRVAYPVLRLSDEEIADAADLNDLFATKAALIANWRDYDTRENNG